MKKIFLTVLLISLFITSAGAINLYQDMREFIEYNPDGQKYEFVKDYISSLGYFKVNARRTNNAAYVTSEGKTDKEKIETVVKSLILDNANLRVARNLLRTYELSDNGLILKVRIMFYHVCDDLIEINTKERQYFEDLLKNNVGDFSTELRKKIADFQLGVALQRKEISKSLLETSILVSQVLISNVADYGGEFFYLGITDAERVKLLDKLYDLDQGENQGGIQEGQTFLGASIAAIREILEDDSWDTLDAL